MATNPRDMPQKGHSWPVAWYIGQSFIPSTRPCGRIAETTSAPLVTAAVTDAALIPGHFIVETLRLGLMSFLQAEPL